MYRCWNHDIEPYKRLPTLTTMATSCKKVKHSCKICLANVTNKSGIQCEGACRSWVHYKCLNFTPGKISDIKRGLIIVSCPCPDCKTDMPKEIVKDEPYSCTNAYCPANIPPKCMNVKCPSNAALPPLGHNSLLASAQIQRPQYGPCTVDTCKSAKVSPTLRSSRFSSKKNKSSSPCVSCEGCSGGGLKNAECVTQTPRYPPPPSYQPIMYIQPPPCPPPQQNLPPQCPPPQCPPPQCPPPQCPPPQFAPPPRPPRNRAQSPKCRYNSNQATKKNTAAIKAMERMCTTMGQLTQQLNTLMDKMQVAMTIPQCPSAYPPPTCVQPSTQTNRCSLTELPCCCPGGSQQGAINENQSMSSCPSMPPCCLQDQANNCDSPMPPCYCASNPLRRKDFC